MTDFLGAYEWAKQYCGDPESHYTRGQVIFDLLLAEGLKPEHKVLDLGCGALSQGMPLIKYLDHGNYVGLDPNGWLVEVAIEKYPQLIDRSPQFLWRSDFDASEAGVEFDYVVAHSVLSHVAHWQMAQVLRNVRKVCHEGSVWLASLRLDQSNSYDTEWQYPGISTFRIQTVQTIGFHAGWSVEGKGEYKHLLSAVAPNDFHDWLKLTATLTPEQANENRLHDEMTEREHNEIEKIAVTEYVRRREEEEKQLEKEMP